MSPYNPFQYSNPVSPEDFIGRDSQVRDIVGRIDNRGESTAIIGPFRCGKTSILQYISDSKLQTTLYSHLEQLIFSYLDIGALSAECDRAQFWERVLKPLQEYIITTSDIPASLSKTYQTCQEKAFDNYELEKLITQLKEAEMRLVLLLDGFDVLIHHPILKDKTEFFGGLRSLASRSKGALALVITGNTPLSDLNKETEHFNRTGSPYFNFMDEVILGPLPEKAINQILSPGDNHFTNNDCLFLTEISVRHPYLLQVAAAILWNIYEEDKGGEPTQLQQRAVEEFYHKVINQLNHTWTSWTLEKLTVFTSVALMQMDSSSIRLSTPNRQRLDRNELISNIMHLKQDRDDLEKYGFLEKDESIQGGWRVQGVFLPFIAAKLEQDFSYGGLDNTSLDKWLEKQVNLDLTKDETNGLVTNIVKIFIEIFKEIITGESDILPF